MSQTQISPTARPLEGHVIWADNIVDPDLEGLVAQAGGTTSSAVDESAFALVTPDGTACNESVEKAEGMGIPVLTVSEAKAEIHRELGLMPLPPTANDFRSAPVSAEQSGPLPGANLSAEPRGGTASFSRLLHDLGLGFLALLAVIVFFAMAPTGQPPVEEVVANPVPGHEAAIRLAERTREANADHAETPQHQEVASGWSMLDYFSIVAAQNNDLLDRSHNTVPVEEPERDNRPAALLTIGVLALCWSRVADRSESTMVAA